MNARDWTLLVLSAAGRPLSPVQLQKALFLIQRQVPGNEVGSGYYKFAAYDYGPFCSAIYSDAEELEGDGLVSITRTVPRGYREYMATPDGVREGNRLRARLRPATAEYLDRLMAWIRPLSFDQLVRSIYKKYPEMKANSVFKE